MPPEPGAPGPASGSASGSGAPGIYLLRPLAEADLEDIWTYTARRWSPGQADEYLRLLLGALAGLATGAKAGRPVDVREGYLKYAVASHVIYHVRGATGLEVVRVLHERMDVARHV